MKNVSTGAKTRQSSITGTTFLIVMRALSVIFTHRSIAIPHRIAASATCCARLSSAAAGERARTCYSRGRAARTAAGRLGSSGECDTCNIATAGEARVLRRVYSLSNLLVVPLDQLDLRITGLEIFLVVHITRNHSFIWL